MMGFDDLKHVVSCRFLLNAGSQKSGKWQVKVHFWNYLWLSRVLSWVEQPIKPYYSKTDF